MIKLPIGYDDFGAVITQKKLTLVDKSLFIKEILDEIETLVIVLTRPRRFGKTLNLSMLHHFLAAGVNGRPTKGLFDNLQIAKVNNGEYLEQQGKYPVIFISFKEVKGINFADALASIKIVIQRICEDYPELETSNKLLESQKEKFKKLLRGEVNEAELANALQEISSLLYRHYNKKVYVLIDEYDTPIQASYLAGYYKEMVNFMRRLLGAVLKTNPCLEKAVITGILRIAKESLFSDVNNIEVYSLLQSKYSQYFGFTEEEVSALLKQANLEDKAEDIRYWYNGYRFGKTIIYNPWSIAHCVNDPEEELQPYWVNTGEHALIRKILTQSGSEFKEKFEQLLQQQVITKIIDEHVVFGDLDHNVTAAWSLLLMAGYLKALSTEHTSRGVIMCQLTIPNHEVNTSYRNLIEQWLANGQGIEWYDLFISHLLNGDIEKFKQDLEQILIQTISAHDLAHQPEAFYHGLMLGLAASLDKQAYEIKSNRESGYGRYDILIIPKDTKKIAIILELKSVAHLEKGEKGKDMDLIALLNQEAKKALEQINQQAYSAELQQRGIANIVKIGLAFCGKRFQLQSERG